MATKNSKDYARDYTKPELREKLKEEIKEGSKGGRSGQWSARKSQILKHEYESHGGDYRHRNAPTPAQKSLTSWSKEDWQTRNGEKAVLGNKTKRYLPKKVWDHLSPQEKKEADQSKVHVSRSGKQFASNTKKTRETLHKHSHTYNTGEK